MAPVVQRVGRWIAAALMVLSLAACQTAQPPQPQTASKQEHSSDWIYFPAEETAVMSDLAQKIVDICRSPSTRQNEETCLRTRIAPDFDPSGRGREGCRTKPDVWDFLKCIVVGNILVGLHDTIADPDFPAMTTAEWMEPAPYQDKLMAVIARQVENECRQDSRGLDDCIRGQLLKMLKLPRTSAERCMPVEGTDAFNTCIAEAYALTVFRAGLARLNEIPV